MPICRESRERSQTSGWSRPRFRRRGCSRPGDPALPTAGPDAQAGGRHGPGDRDRPVRAWLRAHRPDRARPASTNTSPDWPAPGTSANRATCTTCSPRRVAVVAEHIRDYYQDDFAAELVALLPDWTAWLADRNATAVHLADRCLPYAHGEPHKAVSAGDDRPNYLTRVAEQLLGVDGDGIAGPPTTYSGPFQVK